MTGSRDWTDREQIRHTLNAALMVLDRSGAPPPVLVHGGCKMIRAGQRAVPTTTPPVGADAIADDIWRTWGLPVEVHFADWKKYGDRAGPIRNAEMVATRPDLVCAFLLNDSRGTKHTIELAEREGLRLDVIERRTGRRGTQQRQHTHQPWSTPA